MRWTLQLATSTRADSAEFARGQFPRVAAWGRERRSSSLSHPLGQVSYRCRSEDSLYNFLQHFFKHCDTHPHTCNSLTASCASLTFEIFTTTSRLSERRFVLQQAGGSCGWMRFCWTCFHAQQRYARLIREIGKTSARL